MLDKSKGVSTRYDFRIRFVFWCVEMNGAVSIPNDHIRTAFEMYRFHICSFDFIRQNTNRIRLSYRVDSRLALKYRLSLCIHMYSTTKRKCFNIDRSIVFTTTYLVQNMRFELSYLQNV